MVFLLLLTVVIISTIKTASFAENTARSCDALYYEYQCFGSISSPSVVNCEETKLDLTNTNISKVCTSIQLFWNYPMNNLTITITTPFTDKKQAYKVAINNGQLKLAISHVYRILKGQETEVTTTDSTLVQDSDANYQVILKFQGPPGLVYYGVFIQYTAVVKG